MVAVTAGVRTATVPVTVPVIAVLLLHCFDLKPSDHHEALASVYHTACVHTYVQVEDIQGDDVLCTAANHATLDGLVTIFHTERSPDVLNNVQNDLPIMTDDDKSAIQELAAEFEIDFISLSFTRAGEDVQDARDFLDSINMQTTKVPHKTGSIYCCVGCANH